MWFRKVGVYAAAVSVVMLLPMFAFAHATPVSYTPAASATELETPTSISIRFTERIEVGASSLKVYAPDGTEVNEGKGTLDPSDERVLSVPVRDEGEGVYAVSWQVVSVDDGHFTKGAYSFLVDAAGKEYEGGEGGVEISYSSKMPDAVFSFFNLVGESIFIAVLVFLFFLVPSVRKKLPVLNETALDLKTPFLHLLTFGYLFFIAGGVLAVFRKSAELAALQNIQMFESIMVYLASSVGTYALLKILAATAFFLIFALILKKRRQPIGRVYIILLCVLLASILYAQSYISHAAASLFLPELSIAVTLVHLVVKEFIVGAIILLSVLFFILYKKGALAAFSALSSRFDLYFAVALGCAVASGAFITWLHLKHGANLLATEWGVRFIALLGATMLFGALRLFHQFIAVPKIAQPSLQKAMFFTLPFEVVIALCVLFFSGYISLTTPPFTVEQYDFAQEQISEGVRIAVQVHPHEHSAMLISFVEAETGQPFDPKHLTVIALNEEKGVGPNQLVLVQRSEGRYVFPLADLAPAGRWEIGVSAGQTEGYDAHAEFTFTYPQDIVSSKGSDEVRSFDTFGRVVFAVGLAMLVFAVTLFWSSKMRWKRVASAAIASVPCAPKWAIVLFSLSAALVIFGISTLEMKGISAFQWKCVDDGFAWRQAFPARDFEATAPNAVLGCTVHDGHYHFADEEEYDFFIKTQ